MGKHRLIVVGFALSFLISIYLISTKKMSPSIKFSHLSNVHRIDVSLSCKTMQNSNDTSREHNN